MVFLDESDVRITMRARLNTIPSLPPIAYENHTFEPPDFSNSTGGPTLWIEEKQAILDESHSSTGLLQVLGQTIYSVFTPTGQGTRDADNLSALIAQAFEPTQSLNGTVETVILYKTYRQPYMVDEDHSVWSFKSVIINWRAFTVVTP